MVEQIDAFSDEEAERDRILAAHNANHGPMLVRLRSAMRDLSFREWRPVNANDARTVLDLWGIPTGPWMGALFRSKNWTNTGETVKSTAMGSHARILWTYLPAGEQTDRG